MDGSGNLYVADRDNHKIRKITAAGVVTPFAGSSAGYTDGTGTAAQFNFPKGVAIDGSGNLYVSDNFKIRKITPSGVVTTFAGSTNGYVDGTGTSAKFAATYGVAVDGSGNVYVSDYNNFKIRKITPSGVVTTLAGSTAGNADGTGTSAQFEYPNGLTVDGSGNVFVVDNANHNIRRITASGDVTTLAGSTFGYVDGAGTAARFRHPNDVVIDGSGYLFITDAGNYKIRKIDLNCTNPTVPTVTATSPICAGGSTTLNISGTLNDATAWKVYSGSCGGSVVGTTSGTTLSVSPTTTTTYYVRGEGGCVTPSSCGSKAITVNSVPSAAFNYDHSSYCNNTADREPESITTSGGAFSATPSGLLTNTSTGNIYPRGASAGTYQITYTLGGTCPSSSTISIVIEPEPDATWSYNSY